MNWYLVQRNDVRARLLADRHYNRQSIGAPEFTPPGNNIVLIIPDGCAAVAVWASHRPDPRANLLVPRTDGFECWDNPIFRNESGLRSSDLIREALAITIWFWRDMLPRDGFHSFVNPSEVAGVKVRGNLVHGYSFMRAGFELYPERTKQRGLLRWIMPQEKLRQIEPVEPLYEQMSMFNEGREAGR